LVSDVLISLCFFPGAAKETPIVTPLMEYVRQKRAVDCGAQVMVFYFFVCIFYLLIDYLQAKWCLFAV
jgi:hypothetical protein